MIYINMIYIFEQKENPATIDFAELFNDYGAFHIRARDGTRTRWQNAHNALFYKGVIFVLDKLLDNFFKLLSNTPL